MGLGDNLDCLNGAGWNPFARCQGIGRQPDEGLHLSIKGRCRGDPRSAADWLTDFGRSMDGLEAALRQGSPH